MSDIDILLLLAVLLCITLSFLFSGMETGVLALNRFRIRQLMRTGERRAAVLQSFLAHPEDFLWTILVGNTTVNFILFSVGFLRLQKTLGHHRLVEVTVFLTGVFLFYIICELAPKTVFQRYPNRLSLSMAFPFRWIHRILAPLVAVAAWVSRGLLHWTGGRAYTGRVIGVRDELRFMMHESAHDLTQEEKVMINRVLDLPNRRVRHVMVPMSNVASVPADMPMVQVLTLCRDRNLTRLPAFDPQTGRVAGIINLEHILYLTDLNPAKPARDYLQAAAFLPEELLLESALRRMQHTGSRLAIVVGPNSRETGIISLQDVFKVIFGNVAL
ncbi:MAG TPA: CNNM domain-containing protein [Verrucomicrobiae bacterium]|jgi:CBS domain containing-hemolysin-like protein